jgi:hypothetical protein
MVFAGTVLSGFADKSKVVRFEELDVQRLNLVEPDGTLRMVISDKARFPGAIIRGKEHAHTRPDAGLLFFNDEGTEDGGLIFSGHASTTVMGIRLDSSSVTGPTVRSRRNSQNCRGLLPCRPASVPPSCSSAAATTTTALPALA